MLKQYGFLIFLMAEKIIIAEERLPRQEPDGALDEVQKARMLEMFERFHTACESVEMASSADQLTRIISEVKQGTTHGKLRELMADLHRRIYDETLRLWLLHVPSARVEHYNSDKPQFGDKVAEKFPKATEDVQEAHRCFALGRYTACVFHLMRVMELGVQSLGKKLGVARTQEKEWQPILRAPNKT